VGIMHAARLPNHRYRLRATVEYSASRSGRGTISPAAASDQGNPSPRAISIAAFERVYIRPPSMRTTLSGIPPDGAAAASAARPAGD